MRKILVALATVMLAAGATACSKDKDDKSSDKTTTAASGTVKTIQDGVLTVGTNLPGPGFWEGDEVSAITGGFEYAMAQEIAERLGLDAGVEVVGVSFDGLVTGQAQGFDLALSQVTITDERAQVVDFSDSYFESDQGVLAPEGTKVETLADAQKLKWGVQLDTTAQTLLADQIKPDQEPSVYQEVTEAVTALTASHVDAVMLDTSIILGIAAEPDSGLEVVAQFKTGEQYGAVFNKDSSLIDAVNGAIADMKADGTLDKLYEKWLVPQFGGNPADVPFIPLPDADSTSSDSTTTTKS